MNINDKQRNYGKSMLILAIIACCSKVFGFLRDIVLTNVYGASSIADAYLITLSIPDMILELLANTIMVGFVPIAVSKLANSSEELNEFTTSTSKILVILGLIFSSILALFPKQILTLLAPGFGIEEGKFAISFLRVLSFTIVFKTLSSVLHAYLNSTKFFTPSAFLGVLLDFSIIIAIIFSKKLNYVNLLPFGALFGTFLQSIYLIPFARKKGFKLLLKSKIKWEEMKHLFIMSIPALLSIGLMHISSLYNKALATAMGEGSVTLFNHSSRISFFVENIIVSSIATVLYPLLSEYYIAGEKDKIKSTLSDSIEKAITFLLPATVGLFLLSQPIIDVLYGNGAFTSENVLITSKLMRINVLGIVGITIQTLLTRAMFSMKKVKVSIIMSITLLAFYLGSSYLFSKLLDLNGLAIATAISYSVGGIAYYIVINKVCGNINVKSTVTVLLKAVIASFIMGSVIYIFNYFVNISQIVKLVLSVIIGVVLYALMAKVLHLTQFDIKAILKKKKNS